MALAAGAGSRLQPLTLLRPKALCPVAGRPLVDLALDRLAAVTGNGTDRLAVNAHHHAGQVAAHCRSRATVSVEPVAALGTAGALGALREWIGGRDVLLTNADAYLPAGLSGLMSCWDGERCRLLCVPAPGRGDFGDLRYVGACLLPWRAVRDLRPSPPGSTSRSGGTPSGAARSTSSSRRMTGVRRWRSTAGRCRTTCGPSCTPRAAGR